MKYMNVKMSLKENENLIHVHSISEGRAQARDYVMRWGIWTIVSIGNGVSDGRDRVTAKESRGIRTLLRRKVSPPWLKSSSNLEVLEKVRAEILVANGLENVEPTRNRCSSADLQRGLLSLLSNINKSSKPENRREKHISPLPLSSGREHPSYSPILPSQQSLHTHLSEHYTFAMKYKFTTAGIPPLTQRTKHGVVKVDRNGYIELHLPSVSHNTFSISPDSTRIAVTEAGRDVWAGDVESLPWRWTRVYRYASRFVGVCLARIPKISLEIEGVRSRVMLNGDFEAFDTQQGILIRRCAKHGTVKVFTLGEDVEQLEWEGDVSEIPDRWKDLLRLSLELYSRCIKLSNDGLHDEGLDDTARFVSGIGWCTMHGPVVRLLFKDAVRIDVNLEKQEVMYSKPNRSKEKWPLHHDRLPSYIAERLDQCKAFAEAE